MSDIDDVEILTGDIRRRDELITTLRARVASLEAALRRAHGLYCSCDKHNNGLCPAAAALAPRSERREGEPRRCQECSGFIGMDPRTYGCRCAPPAAPKEEA